MFRYSVHFPLVIKEVYVFCYPYGLVWKFSGVTYRRCVITIVICRSVNSNHNERSFCGLDFSAIISHGFGIFKSSAVSPVLKAIMAIGLS